MIVIGGLTPAWQHILVFEDFRPGRVNRASETRWCASGKVLNAALAAYHLGGLVRVLAAVGGQTRRQIEDDLEVFELDYRWVVTESPTRVCVTVIDRARQEVTELVEEAGPLTQAELDQFAAAWREEVAKARVALLIGSLPTRTSPDYYRELAASACCPLIVDCAGPPLLATLNRRPFLVKPNREELERTLGCSIRGDEELRRAIEELRAQGAERVLVTNGPAPAWFSGPEGKFRFHPPGAAHKVNPIGSGDALAGAIAVALTQGKNIIEAIKIGMGAAVDNLEQLLPCRLRPTRVAELAAQVWVEQIG
ncbi:MAG: PfkB family carbohydrate kinase [Thermoguttaceae bacterium]|nr:PfkB family carbohydrate kinase [Thermoguttaceae bacterium]MDW8079792.1 PfkB family carbohydrate kinase [Thermoguttaceae bacterium]